MGLEGSTKDPFTVMRVMSIKTSTLRVEGTGLVLALALAAATRTAATAAVTGGAFLRYGTDHGELHKGSFMFFA